MKRIDMTKISHDECMGVQMLGTRHCTSINCKWQGLTACQGRNIILTGKNSKGFVIGPTGLAEETEEKKNSHCHP